MIIQGTVVKVLPPNQIEAILLTSTGCKDCSGCSGGSCSDANKIILPNTLSKKVGDSIEVELSSSVFYKSIFISFFLPLLLFIAALGVADKLNIPSNLAILGASAFFAVSFFAAKSWDKSLRNKSLYRLLK